MAFLSNNADSNDPTRQCTCGFRRFRTRPIIESEAVQRWVMFDSGAFGGMGSMPFGLFFGAGGVGDIWGLFDGTLRSFSEQVVCENCARIRSTKLKSAYTLFGSFIVGDTLYVIVADVEGTGTGCIEVRFDGPGAMPNVSLSFAYPVLPIAAPAPALMASSPLGAAAGMLSAKLPPAIIEGEYTIVFVDRCGGFEENLGLVTLESDVIILNPNDADLNGAPDLWLRNNVRAKQETVQIGSGSSLGIPFDKCDGVIEYDARFGTDPVAQGFTAIGAPGGSLLPGGVVRITSPGGVVPTFYRQDLTLVSAVDRVNVYARVQHRANIDADAVGQGFNVLGAAAAGSSNPFEGVRFRQYRLPVMTLLDGSGDTAFSYPFLGKGPEGWRTLAAHSHFSDDRGSFYRDDQSEEAFPDSSTVWGTIAGPAGVDPVLRSEFGDLKGSGIDTLVRNVVVSSPGRFIRAWFKGFATVDNPILRLSLVSDQKVGSYTTARFLVRYGSQAQGDDPYAIPSSTVSLTVDFITQNQLFVAPFTLAGLQNREDFWFTVERDHTHGDDVGDATVFLMGATVRAI